jgi:hypothetical protein
LEDFSPVAPFSSSAPGAWGSVACAPSIRWSAQPLRSVRIALVEFDAIGDLLDGVAVEVDLEFIHALRMEAGTGHGPGDRMANIDHEHRADFAAKEIKIGDVQPDVLSGYRRVQVMRHDSFLFGIPARHHRRGDRGLRRLRPVDENPAA